MITKRRNDTIKIRIPSALKQRLKDYALANDVSMSDVINELIEGYLKREARKEKRIDNQPIENE